MAAQGGRIYYTFTGEEESDEHGDYIFPPDITHVETDESVKVISRGSFASKSLFDSRSLPLLIVELICHAGVKRIESAACWNCPQLRRLIIPGVEVVEDFAFCRCEAVTDIECDNLERIGGGTFALCISLGNINLPSAKVVEYCAFQSCVAMKDALFGKNLESIGKGAFVGCHSLGGITIPLKKGLIRYDDTFAGCDNLKRVDLVEGLVLNETVAALLLEAWRDDMNEEIDSINSILPNASSGGRVGFSFKPGYRFEAGEKAMAIREWIARVLNKIIHYKAEHRSLLNEVNSALQLVLPKSVVVKNVLPFLELPLHSFDGEGCSSCGTLEIDEIELKVCDKCNLARYCGDECQENHRQLHEATCKEWAAELRDEKLFRQPESSHLGDCPICFLPLPLDKSKSMLYSCCCKIICIGCCHANQIREVEQGLEHSCPFCRKLPPENNDEDKTRLMTRVAVNDPVAVRQIGVMYREERDYEKAFDYFSRAAELGDADAHHSLSGMYFAGHGVERDEEKGKYHFEEAAIAGHIGARWDLGMYEMNKERSARAAKHFIIAANLGCDRSIQVVREYYKCGYVSKDEYKVALRAYQSAGEEMKSPQREEAAKY